MKPAAIVDFHEHDGVVIIRFEVGQIDADNIDTARHQIFQFIDTHLPRKVLINMRHVGYLHSLGIGLLTAILKRVQGYQGQLRLCSLQPEVDELLTITHMHTVFDCYDTEPSALAAFHEPSATGR